MNDSDSFQCTRQVEYGICCNRIPKSSLTEEEIKNFERSERAVCAPCIQASKNHFQAELDRQKAETDKYNIAKEKFILNTIANHLTGNSNEEKDRFLIKLSALIDSYKPKVVYNETQ